jgi:serine/threonine protein kinase
MSKPIESFFDEKTVGYKLWQKPTGTMNICQSEIVFQAPLLKPSAKGLLKLRYFVLTPDHLFYLESEQKPRLIAVMPTAFVRVDYLLPGQGETSQGSFCFRFIRNMRFFDLFAEDETSFREWRTQLARVFIQCDFHSKFNTIKLMGKGSFARVYLVEDKETKAKYAVKAFSKEYVLSQAKGKESLINEIAIMQKLHHPYIMNLEEVHESKNSVYLVLELLQGGELLSYLSTKESFSTGDVVRVMRCILEALAYMADKKIMHRDLKPENMILKEKNKLEFCTLKLVDFGLATVYDIPEYLFKRCGTPGFVAPEVINAPSNENIHYLPKCDVFSAGVVMYLLLTDKSPFDGKSFKEILQKNKLCKIDFKHPKLKKNSQALDILTKMMDPNPITRVSARDALKHPFFGDSEDACMQIEGEMLEPPMFSGYLRAKEEQKLNFKYQQEGSLVIRDNIINGRTDSIHESSNSQGAIFSFKSMTSPKKMATNAPRESILKYVLLQNTNPRDATIYDHNFTEEEVQSDCEEVF